MCIRVLFITITAWLAGISLPAWGGATLTPAHTDLSYSGSVKLSMTVATGASADIDIFLDSNQNGAIDTGEIPLRHYTVKDGQMVPPTGSVLVTDTDGLANGSITAPILNYAVDDRIAGHFVVRAKSGSTISQATFINDPPSYAQSVSGQLMLAGVGKPGAVFLLDSQGEMIYPVLTNATGQYTLPAPAAGNYQVAGVIINEVGSRASGVAVTVAAGQKKTNVNISYASAPYRLKGKALRSDISQGIPYLWLAADDDAAGAWSLGVTDASGNFDIGIRNGAWKLMAAAALQLGFVSESGNFADYTNRVVISGATMTGKDYRLTPLASFVTGRARNGKTMAYMAGAKLVASPPGTNNWAAEATSDSNGYWALGVAAGQWDVYPQLDIDTDLYKTMLYPSKKYSISASFGQSPQNIGNIDLLPADATVAVKVVDHQSHPQQGLYVFGCDQGISNSYISNAGSTDSNGMVNVPVRNNKTWFVGVITETESPAPPQHRLDVLALDGNVITLFPEGYRNRPYRVYGGSNAPANLNYPQDSGFVLLGKATGRATVKGSYPYYCIVAYDGEVLLDSIMGSNGSYYGVAASTNTLNPSRVAGMPDGLYATIGNQGGALGAGSVSIHPGTTITGLTVIHPDQRYTAAQGWSHYDLVQP